MSRSPRRSGRRTRGFTIIEVLIATAILIIAVSAMAALAAIMLTRGRQSRYINVAETLASEKLEDLNRWNMNAPAICVQTGDTSEGSLTTPVTSSITCPNGVSTGTVSYFDDISIDFTSGSNCANASYGCFSETVSGSSSGTSGFFTTYHSPDGVIPGNSDGTPVFTTTAPTNLVFHRTWLIEANTPVTNVRRITVRVTLTDQSVKPSVSAQMSLVRQ
jgi:type II secretory pathway pseudopilin PulG